MDNAQLARQHVLLVHRIAYHMAKRLPFSVAVDDLISAGLVGLAEAIVRRDVTKDDTFEAYASTRIRGAMLDELRERDPLTRDDRQRANKIRATIHQLTCQLGHPPDVAELAACLKISLDALHTIFRRISVNDEMVELSDDVGEPHGDAHDSLTMVLASHRWNELNEAIVKLPSRLQRLLTLYYIEDRTFAEISVQFELTESRICQLHAEALVRLRTILEKAQPEQLQAG